MSRHLNEDAMASELAGSAFFNGSRTNPPDQPQKQETIKPSPRAGQVPSMTPRAHDTVTPSAQPISQDVLETIRKAVKQLGKEDATYRFTTAEKKGLAEIVYSYAAADIRTTQNEIARIGINYLLEDYRANGSESILARVLERLNA